MSELAITEDHGVAHTGDEQLVTMKIDKQLFGLPILSAQDIVETHTITQVPMAPSAVAGVMNLRGRIVTVINLRRIIGQEDNIASRMGVTVEHDGDLYTILVDAIGEVMSVASEDLEPVPTTLHSELKSLCKGIYRLETGLLALLDIDEILDAETILQTPIIDFAARRRLQKKLEEDGAHSLTRISRTVENEKDAQEEEAKTKAEAEAKAKAKAKLASDEKSETSQDAPIGSAEPACDDAVTPDPDQAYIEPLYQRIGGSPAIEAAVEIFYEKVMGDEGLADFFDGVDMRRQRKMLNDFISMSLGGPSPYAGKALRAAHARLVNEKGLGNEHFDAVVSHLQATLTELKVPSGMIDEALSTVGGTRDDVLGG